MKAPRLLGLLLLCGALAFAAAGSQALVALGRAERWVATGRASQPVCSYRARTGQPCLGCGGTRALELAARGEWRAAWATNPLAAWAAVVAWVTSLLGAVAVFTGNGTWLKTAAWTVGLTAPLAFVWNFAWWWHALPRGPLGP